LLEADELTTDESTVTGEAYPAELANDPLRRFAAPRRC
jgi:hypothetical protein